MHRYVPRRRTRNILALMTAIALLMFIAWGGWQTFKLLVGAAMNTVDCDLYILYDEKGQAHPLPTCKVVFVEKRGD